MTHPLIRDLASARSLSELEEAIIQRLLAASFPGREEVARQVLSAKVIAECQCGCRSVLLGIEDDAPKAPVNRRVPVQGMSKDADGTPILFLLHVVAGVLNELEILRADSKPVSEMPQPGSIELSTD